MIFAEADIVSYAFDAHAMEEILGIDAAGIDEIVAELRDQLLAAFPGATVEVRPSPGDWGTFPGIPRIYLSDRNRELEAERLVADMAHELLRARQP